MSRRPFTPGSLPTTHQRGLYSDILGPSSEERIRNATRGPDTQLSARQQALLPEHAPKGLNCLVHATGEVTCARSIHIQTPV